MFEIVSATFGDRTFRPSGWADVKNELAQRVSGEMVGMLSGRQALLTAEFHDLGCLVMVEPLEGLERCWLSEPTLGQEPVRVTCCVLDWDYPRMFLTGDALVLSAARYFFDTGECAPGMDWVDEKHVLERYELFSNS